jgi:hypothetical protein
MTFAHPYALFLGLIALPIIALYLRKLRWRRQSVTTGMFWEQVFAEQPARSRWQPWRTAASAAVQLCILALIVLALAGPQIRPPRQIVLVVDNGAHMNATDVKPSRLAAANEVARRLIDGLNDYDQTAVLSTAPAPAVHCVWTGDRTKLQGSLQAVAAGESPSQMAATITLARRMAADRPGAKIVVLSDGCCSGAAELAGQPGIEWLRLGTPAGNAAVTRLAARWSLAEPSTCEVLVEVRNFADGPLAGRLLTARDGEPLGDMPLNLPPDGLWQQVFSVPAAGPGPFSARLEPADALPADNVATVELPSGNGVSPDGTPMLAQWEAAESALREHDLRVPGNVGSDAAAFVAGRAGQPLGLWLAAAALALCAAEWCLYQRRWLS